MSERRKTALITGITGQDGSYLAELLLGKGYLVHGIVRRSSSFNTDRIEHLYRDPHDPEARLFLHYGDLVDGTGLREVLTRVQPDEVRSEEHTSELQSRLHLVCRLLLEKKKKKKKTINNHKITIPD